VTETKSKEDLYGQNTAMIQEYSEKIGAISAVRTNTNTVEKNIQTWEEFPCLALRRMER